MSLYERTNACETTSCAVTDRTYTYRQIPLGDALYDD